MNQTSAVQLIKETFSEWSEDKVPRLAAALAYYTAFALAPLLLWVYYSAQILFFGAEFTQVYAKTYGSKIEPAENAVPVTEETRAQQGIPRQKQVEQTAQLLERQAGGSDPASDPHTDQSPRSKPAGALAGFLVGLVLGRRQRAKE
jgi:membrane protein